MSVTPAFCATKKEVIGAVKKVMSCLPLDGAGTVKSLLLMFIGIAIGSVFEVEAIFGEDIGRATASAGSCGMVSTTIQSSQDRGQGDGVPKAGGQQAAADSRRSRTCVCANTQTGGWHMQGEKDELTSCRGTVLSAWHKPPVRRQGGRARLLGKGK